MSHYRKLRPSHHVRPKMVEVCDLTNYIYKDLPIGDFRMSVGCGQIMDHENEGNVILAI